MAEHVPYRCFFCNYPIDPKAPGTYELVTGWVRQGSNSNLRVVEHIWRYAHKPCLEVAPAKEQVESLF